MKNILLAHSILTLVLGAVILGALEKGGMCENESMLQSARLLILIGCVVLVACIVNSRCSPGNGAGALSLVFATAVGIVTTILYLRIITNLKKCGSTLSEKQQSNYSITVVLIGVVPSVLLILQSGKNVIMSGQK